ncbi:MAG: SIMPL domain-containing protein [Cyanobium sp.]
MPDSLLSPRAGLRPRLAILPLVLALPLMAPLGVRSASAQVQLSCGGTLLEARGAVEQERAIRRLQLSLSLEAEGATSDAALGLLQARLAAVRSGLQGLGVEELRVSSPSTWPRTDSRGRPAGVQAALSVSGRLAPAALQPLVRQVGALSGVRLAPVTPLADPAQDLAVRRRLLTAAYDDARAQAAEVAAAIGRQRLEPLEVQLDGGEPRPMPMMARAEAAPPPPFDPAELAAPKDRLSLLVRFCAR